MSPPARDGGGHGGQAAARGGAASDGGGQGGQAAARGGTARDGGGQGGNADTLHSATELAGQVIGLMVASGRTLAVAESLTGGMLAATLTAIPGASAVFRGGIVAYATELKAALLDVPAGLLAQHGPVHPEVAAAMAAGARARLGATVGAATTGVAGPNPADGQPVGTVYIAVSAGRDTVVRALALTGDRHRIRVATVERSLELLMGTLGEEKG